MNEKKILGAIAGFRKSLERRVGSIEKRIRSLEAETKQGFKRTDERLKRLCEKLLSKSEVSDVMGGTQPNGGSSRAAGRSAAPIIAKGRQP